MSCRHRAAQLMDGAGVAGAALADRTVTNARGADMGDDHLGPLSGGTDTARHVRADGSINGDAASDKGSNASEGRAGSRSDTHIRRTMTTRERLFLKPWEKTTRFGRFPGMLLAWLPSCSRALALPCCVRLGKLVLDLLLTVLVTSQVRESLVAHVRGCLRHVTVCWRLVLRRLSSATCSPLHRTGPLIGTGCTCSSPRTTISASACVCVCVSACLLCVCPWCTATNQRTHTV